MNVDHPGNCLNRAAFTVVAIVVAVNSVTVVVAYFTTDLFSLLLLALPSRQNVPTVGIVIVVQW